MTPSVLCDIICKILDMVSRTRGENVAVVNNIIIFMIMASFEGMSRHKLIWIAIQK